MIILISGASTGIGYACAVHLAERGQTVWAGVRNDAAASRLAAHAVEAKLDVRPVKLDVTDEDSVRVAVKHVLDASGSLDVLINNAGVAIGGPVEGVPLSHWRRQFEVNLFGAVALTQACLPAIRLARGRIVNLGSISGRLALPFLAPYAASKYALEALSDSLRREVKSHGVHVSLIEPGAIATPIWDKAVGEGNLRFNDAPADVRSVYAESLRRFNRALDETIKRAGPVTLVTRAVDHAVHARRPRARYPVGRGIRLAAWLANVTPDAVFDRVLG